MIIFLTPWGLYSPGDDFDSEPAEESESGVDEQTIDEIEGAIFEDFKTAFNEMQRQVYRNSVKHGFWDGGRNDGEAIALMHSELSEALEAKRNGLDWDEHCPGEINMAVELADCIIRIMDYAQGSDFDIAEALVAKHQYNVNRPHKHGKEF